MKPIQCSRRTCSCVNLLPFSGLHHRGSDPSPTRTLRSFMSIIPSLLPVLVSSLLGRELIFWHGYSGEILRFVLVLTHYWIDSRPISSMLIERACRPGNRELRRHHHQTASDVGIYPESRLKIPEAQARNRWFVHPMFRP